MKSSKPQCKMVGQSARAVGMHEDAGAETIAPAKLLQPVGMIQMSDAPAVQMTDNRQKQIAHIRSAIAAGIYQVSAEVIADCIISEARMTGKVSRE